MDLSREHKKEVQYDILRVIASSLENETLKKDGAAKIARFVLARIDEVGTHEQIATFVAELSVKWPIFSNIASVEKAEVRKMVEEEVTHGVLTLLEHGKVDHALALVKTMSQENPRE